MKLIKYLIASSIINLFLVVFFVVITQKIPQQSSPTTILPIKTTNNSTTSKAPENAEQVTQNKDTVKNSNSQPTTTPTSAPPIPKPQKPQCLVKIDGAAYDLEEFRSFHGGGDIFQCGTDMTNVFYSQHSKSYLEIIAKYRIQ
ncbi:hypothetical protein KA017_01010 [Candidatus Woesebacteria bacterium]|nr:hypothetical protein [Candidatus Woesebacteria bacterium]